MPAPEFYPATLRVAVLWGGPQPAGVLLESILFLTARGTPVDIAVLPGAATDALTSRGLNFHTDNAYLEGFISSPGCKCLLCGTRTDGAAADIIALCAKYGVPALDVGPNSAATVMSIWASGIANLQPVPRTATPSGRALFPDMGYERYIRLMGIARAVAPDLDEPFSLLDIGGEDGALREFLPAATYQAFAGLITREQDSGLPTAGFDVVVAADVLEHVLPADRSAFLAELLRLARRKVVFSFPCAGADLHEQFLLNLLPGHPWLAEHQEHGLPAVQEIEALLREQGLRFTRIPNHSLQNWAYSVLFDMIPVADDLRRAVNLFLQEHAFPLENSEPAYRFIYVIEK